jgi:MATE family multidrug resistance protein
VNIAFLGNLSKNDLAAAALATSWFNIGNITLSGGMSAIDTFLTQTYGAKQYSNYGTWTGNSLFIVSVATIVVSGFMALCGPILHFAISDKQIAAEAGLYALRLIPGLFPLYWCKVLFKYMQVQNILAPSVLIGILANGINFVGNWGLINKAGLGIAGSAYTTSLTRALQFLMKLMFMLFNREKLFKKTWPTVSCKNFTTETLLPFMRMAGQGAFALFVDAAYWETTTFFAAL